jgi:hypothetical protein
MTTVAVRTRSTHVARPTAFERILLESAAVLAGLALRHMHRRAAAADVERRREHDADARRDAQAAGNLSLLPR